MADNSAAYVPASEMANSVKEGTRTSWSKASIANTNGGAIEVSGTVDETYTPAANRYICDIWYSGDDETNLKAWAALDPFSGIALPEQR